MYKVSSFNSPGLQIVDVHVEHLDGLEVAILGVLKVEPREPVGTHITLDESSSALGLAEFLPGRVRVEVAGAHDGVHMPREGAGIDDGVEPGVHERAISMVTKHSEGTLIANGGGSADE